MNDKQIEQLLIAFYNGTASGEDELRLKAFFMDGNVPERWRNEQRCFNAVYSVPEIPIPEGLAARIEARIDFLTGEGKGRNLRRVVYWAGGVAAAVLLCFCLYIGDEKFHSQPEIADTYSDPEEAVVVAGKVLSMMSAQLNKGVKQISDAEKEIDKINCILNKNMINK